MKAISTKKIDLGAHPPAGQGIHTEQEVVIQSRPQPTRQSLSYKTSSQMANYNTNQLMKAFQSFLTEYPRSYNPRNIFQNPPNHN